MIDVAGVCIYIVNPSPIQARIWDGSAKIQSMRKTTAAETVSKPSLLSERN